jgi:hypothetical protein
MWKMFAYKHYYHFTKKNRIQKKRPEKNDTREHGPKPDYRNDGSVIMCFYIRDGLVGLIYGTDEYVSNWNR